MTIAPGGGAERFVSAEEFAEGGLIGEAEFVGDMGDGVLAEHEHGFSLTDEALRDARESTLSRGDTDAFGDIFGREMELIGIETEFVLLSVASIYEVHKAIGDLFLARMCYGYVRLNRIYDTINKRF